MTNIVMFFPRPWPGTGMAGRLPYALIHLKSHLKKHGINVRIIDERMEQDLESSLEGLEQAECFGISSFTGIQISNGLKISALLKKKYPKIPVVWGGWHPTSMPKQTLEHPLVDIVVRGQGETAFRELIDALRNGKSLEGIKGLSYKKGNEIVSNPDSPVVDFMKDLEIDYGEIDVEKYIFRQPWGDRTIGMIASMGCPYDCTFCAVSVVYKRHTYYRDIDRVISDIDYLVAKHGINAVTFDDDNFFVSVKRVREFCAKLIAKPYKISWDAGAHVGLLLKAFGEEDIKLIRDSGCRQLHIGAESGSDEVLRILDKKATVAENVDYVKKVSKYGIRSFLSTMVCVPGTSTKDIYDTTELILKCRRIDPHIGYRLFYYTPYPCTPLYKTAVENGMKEPANLEEWSHHTLRKFKGPWITKAQRKLVRYFVFYYFPYSSRIKDESDIYPAGPVKKFLKAVYKSVFANFILRWIARWRVENSFYKFPVDAEFVIFGERLRNIYTKAAHGSGNIFEDYED
ncbi:MAG: B12-binding domain-containing radical SAM protein [Endomicrobiales bacterium]|nr:B12-binding domain-containing radical SAM protein [Endomicrobiales bacterium]